MNQFAMKYTNENRTQKRVQKNIKTLSIQDVDTSVEDEEIY